MRNDIDLSRMLRDESDRLGVARLERRVRATVRALPERRRRRRRRAVAIGGSIAALACVLGWVAIVAPSEPVAPGPLMVLGTPPTPFTTVETDALDGFDLSDGSRLVLAPQTELEVARNTGDHVELRLARGRALFSIRPGGPRRWVIDAGSVQVEVLGTRFEVVRGPSRITVSVQRGRVRVYGDAVGGERRLGAGDALTIDLVASEPPRTTTTAAAGTPEAPELAEPPPALASPPERSSWQALAARGDVEAAHQLLDRGRLAQIARTTASPEELFLLADVARRAGTPEESVVPLRRILDEHSTDARTPLAALTLGRVLDDRLGRPGEAGDVFARAAELGLPDELAAVARERAFDAYLRAGLRSEAERAASAYLERHPRGRASARLATWLAQIGAP